MKEKTEGQPQAVNFPITLSVSNNQAVTNSRDVACVFEKQHKHVLRDIRELDIPADFRESNFGPNKIKVLNNPDGEETESYDMTKDGFVLLAMGYTGAKAMKFKLAYIEAFNKMEAALIGKQTPMAPLSPAQQRQVQKLIADKVYATGVQKKYAGVLFRQVYRQIKDTFGVAIYRDVPQNAFKYLMELINMITLEQPKQISDVPEGFKKCSGCKQILPMSDFYQNRSTSDGLHHACIPCHKNALKRSISGTAEMERSVETETVMENIVARAVETALSKHTMMVYEQPAPVPATRQAKDWQSTWNILCDTHSDLSKAVEQLRKEVTGMLPQDHLQLIPKGVDVLEHIHLHYSPMERAARQINVLSELLMWRSPKVMNGNMELGNPRY